MRIASNPKAMCGSETKNKYFKRESQQMSFQSFVKDQHPSKEHNPKITKEDTTSLQNDFSVFSTSKQESMILPTKPLITT